MLLFHLLNYNRVNHLREFLLQGQFRLFSIIETIRRRTFRNRLAQFEQFQLIKISRVFFRLGSMDNFIGDAVGFGNGGKTLIKFIFKIFQIK